jgi:Heat shock protein 9/12
MSDPARKSFYAKVTEGLTPGIFKSKATEVAEETTDAADLVARQADTRVCFSSSLTKCKKENPSPTEPSQPSNHSQIKWEGQRTGFDAESRAESPKSLDC